MYIRIFKPFFDFIIALIGLVLIWPFLLCTALVLVFVHKGSPIFKQKRIGQHAKPFTIYKFKTISKTGKISAFLQKLRNYKIDELPQLVNILKFEMSFVGPRPDIPGYYDRLPKKYQCILDLKPGITGMASLAFSNEEELLKKQENPLAYNDQVIFPKKLRINSEYRKNISLFLDIKIMIKTLFLPFQ